MKTQFYIFVVSIIINKIFYNILSSFTVILKRELQVSYTVFRKVVLETKDICCF